MAGFRAERKAINCKVAFKSNKGSNGNVRPRSREATERFPKLVCLDDADVVVPRVAPSLSIARWSRFVPCEKRVVRDWSRWCSMRLWKMSSPRAKHKCATWERTMVALYFRILSNDDSYKFLKDMREQFIKLDDDDLRNKMNMVTFRSQFNQSS